MEVCTSGTVCGAEILNVLMGSLRARKLGQSTLAALLLAKAIRIDGRNICASDERDQATMHSLRAQAAELRILNLGTHGGLRPGRVVHSAQVGIS